MNLSELMLQIDTDASGCISKPEFVDALGIESISLLFSSLDLNANDTCALFEMLDSNDDGKVDIAEFVEGCRKLAGGARAFEVCKELLYIQKDVARGFQSQDERF